MMKVENNIATISNSETWVQFPADLSNGYYDLILNEPFLISELPEPERDNYPFPPTGQITNFGTISSKDIVLYSACVANDELRPVISSIFINHEFIVSSNTHVLRWKRHEQPISPDHTVLFTPAAVIITKCKETDEPVQIALIADAESGLYENIEFTFAGCKIIHRMTKGNYPAFLSAIPDFDNQQVNFFSIHSSLIAEVLKTSKAFAAEVLQVSDKGFIVENTDTKLFKQFQVPEKAENPNRKPDGIIMPMMITNKEGNNRFNSENGTYLGISPVELTKFTTLFTGKIVLGWYDNRRAIGVWLYPENQITKAPKPATIQKQKKQQDSIKTSLPQSLKPSPGLQLIRYSDRAVALIGDTKQIKDKLKELWGRYNPHLRINGETVKGWVFSAKRESQLRQLIAS